MTASPSNNRSEGSLGGYFRTVGRHRIVSIEEERALVDAAAGGSRDARDRLILANLAFVVKVAREYRGIGMPLEDLLSEGTVGLIEAAERFDPSRGTRFVTYATWWVRKRILEALSDRSHLVRVPAARLRQLRSILDVEKRLSKELGRPPDIAELQAETGERRETIDRARQLHGLRSGIEPKPDDEGGDPLDRIEAPDSDRALDRLLDDEDVVLLREALLRLEPREMLVMALRFGLGGDAPMTLAELGTLVDLSRERIRQIELKATAKIRRWIRLRSSRDG